MGRLGGMEKSAVVGNEKIGKGHSVRIMYLWIVQCVQMTYLGKIYRQKYNECAGNIATLL